MRNELTLIERIEAYLNNQLPVSDRTAFEQEMAGDPQLQEKVALQRQLSAGLERTVLKDLVKKIAKRYKTKRILKQASIVILITVLAGVVIWYLSDRHTHPAGLLPKDHTPLPAQTFRIDPSADTVLETAGGITFSILANTFTDNADDVVTDSVDIEIKEALDAASIMKAGLSTMAGDSLLETGGMFFIAASLKGAALQLQHPVYTEIPTKEIIPGMQLYKGEIPVDGIINWKDPVPLEHDLTPVDISKLNFYPPGYLKFLFFEGYDTLNKPFTDSLYYSFSADFANRGEYGAGDSSHGHCGINPANVKAVWSEQFQQTFIATREFEERMHWIHVAGVDELLGLYVSNLGMRLSDVDKMVANHLDGSLKEKFFSFASRNDGKVTTTSAQRRQLQLHYKVKAAALVAAVLQTQQVYRQREDSMRAAAAARKEAYAQKVTVQQEKNFQEELALNTKSVFRQLGYSMPRPAPAPSRVYAASISTAGWYNIDRIALITAEKESAGIHMNGRLATIDYQQVSFTVQGEYDRVHVYLLPDQLTSFIRLPSDSTRYVYKLNSLMKYSVMCIAYKGTQAYYYGATDVKPGEHVLALVETGDNALSMQINRYAGSRMASEIEDERKYLLQLSMDEQVEDVRLAHEKFYCMLIHILFPCRNYAPTAPALAPSPGVRTVVLYQGGVQVDSYTVYDAVDEYIGTPDKYYQREYIPECSPK